MNVHVAKVCKVSAEAMLRGRFPGFLVAFRLSPLPKPRLAGRRKFRSDFWGKGSEVSSVSLDQGTRLPVDCWVSECALPGIGLGAGNWPRPQTPQCVQAEGWRSQVDSPYKRWELAVILPSTPCGTGFFLRAVGTPGIT